MLYACSAQVQMQRVLCQLQVLCVQADCMQCCNIHTQAGCKTKQRQMLHAQAMQTWCRRSVHVPTTAVCVPLLGCAWVCSSGAVHRLLQPAALTWLTIWCCCTIRFSLNSSDSTWTSYIAPHPPARKRSPAVRPPAERCRRPPPPAKRPPATAAAGPGSAPRRRSAQHGAGGLKGSGWVTGDVHHPDGGGAGELLPQDAGHSGLPVRPGGEASPRAAPQNELGRGEERRGGGGAKQTEL